MKYLISNVSIDAEKRMSNRPGESNSLQVFVARNQYYPTSFLKRSLDVLVATLGLLLVSPLLLILVVALRLQQGPMFFSQKRVGMDGELFKCFKFRTMVVDAEEKLQELINQDSTAAKEWEKCQKLKNDPRITRIGSFLRKSSLDELPQLYNVLKGDMSLVGPRPVTPEELKRYGASKKYYLRLKPGITGIWQISGRSDVDYSRRVAMDRRYSMAASPIMDLRILSKTVLVVLAKKGAV